MFGACSLFIFSLALFSNTKEALSTVFDFSWICSSVICTSELVEVVFRRSLSMSIGMVAYMRYNGVYFEQSYLDVW